MPEKINNLAVFSLLEVSLSIKKTLSERYQSSFWVKAEMNKLNLYPQSGHCYPELVEKKDGKIVAQLKATLWKDDFIRINSQFQTVLKEPLKNGIKILFCARITFDPGHGLSLQISDIDPAYSLGELEKEKAESIERLKKEGLFDLNKKLSFPLLPQRIAIISVETSKGYADFKNLIGENQWGYHFFTLLFPALLQGEKAISAICFQLSQIRKVVQHFDVVVIVRGGGGDVGLSCYNNYRLSREIANFPIPVLTGIGHATNETVSEMVSFKNAITPSALASFLIQSFHNFSVPVQRAEEFLRSEIKTILHQENELFTRLTKDFRQATIQVLDKSGYDLRHATQVLVQQIRFRTFKEKENIEAYPKQLKRAMFLQFQKSNMELKLIPEELKRKAENKINSETQGVLNLERIVISMGPEKVLKRGFSITRIKGKSIKSSAEVKENSIIETTLADGILYSKIEKNNNIKHEH